MKSTIIPVAALALVDSRGFVLMQRRPLGKQHGGLWEFPGGKIEPGEGPRRALVREIAEELALAIDPADLCEVSFAATEPDAGESPVLLLLYSCMRWTGQPVCLEPGCEIDWFDSQTLPTLAMPPLDVPLAQAILPILDSVMK